MATKLSDAEFIARHRAANRARSQRNRQRRYGAGNVALTVWVAESTKAALLALAAAESAPIAVVVDRLLSAALNPATDATSPSPVDSAPTLGERDRRIMALHESGLSNYKIAAQVGCSEPTIRRVLKRAKEI